MDRRAFLAGAAALTGGCLTVGAGSDSEHDVGMTLQAFDPATLTVEAGTEVVWKNTSSRGHTVTAYEADIPEAATYFASGGYEGEQAARDAFNSAGGGMLYGGDTFSYTFEVPGTYEYVCLPHERGGMLGTIEVEE